ncbi:MAG: galactonate dehydratase [Chloroflexota bacterium]
MKLAQIETFLVRPRWLFVRLEADSGDVGWGEASLEGYGEAVVGAFEALKDRFIGQDPRQIEDIWQVAYRGGFYRGGPVLMSALSGLDQALWDMKARRLGVPIWELLGGQVRNRVRSYAWTSGDRADQVVSYAEKRIEQGFRAVKMNATPESSYFDSQRELEKVVERVQSVQALGLEVGVEFHGRIHRTMAKQLLRLLEPLGVMFVEEPILSEQPAAIKELKQNSSIPIALGERLYSRWDFRPFLEQGIVDIIQPDLSHAGGISEVRRIAAMAETYDVAVAPHCPLGPIALASCLQLAACTPNAVLQEVSLGIHYNVEADLYTYLKDPTPLSPVDGFLPILHSPGLGIELDEEKIRREAADPHRWRNPLWRLEDGSFAEW